MTKYINVKFTERQAQAIHDHIQIECLCGMGNKYNVQAIDNACEKIDQALHPKKQQRYKELCKMMEPETESSECCGAKFMDDSDLCPQCGDHTGREL